MSRTDLDATTLASGLRMRAGDGSMEWVYEPIQSSVVLDIADMLDERDELCAELGRAQLNCDMWHDRAEDMRNRLSAKQAENAKLRAENAKLRELCEDIYKRFRGVVFECWAYSSEDFRMYEQLMRELGIEVPS